MKKLIQFNDHKRSLANQYFQLLDGNKFILPSTHPDYFDVFHIFNIRHSKRDQLREYLLINKIQTDIHYPLSPYKQKALKTHFEGMNYPISDLIHNTTLSLPISFSHKIEDIEFVCSVLNDFKY